MPGWKRVKTPTFTKTQYHVIMRILFFAALLLAVQSCTLITSKNIPGKKEKAFPSKLIGKYELILPSDFAGMMGDAKIYVELKNDRIVLDNAGKVDETILNDSLFYTTAGKSAYLCMGVEPELTVFKMVPGKSEIKLYPMFAAAGTKSEALSDYFTEVEEIPGEPDENGEIGESSFSVHIVDAKLDKFFSSSVAYKDPFVLKKVK